MDNLVSRNICLDADDIKCVFCGVSNQSIEHIFLSCNKIHPLWIKFFSWFGCFYICSENLRAHFEMDSSCVVLNVD